MMSDDVLSEAVTASLARRVSQHARARIAQPRAMATPRRMMLLCALLLPALPAAALADTCDAGAPCLKLNTSVFMSEMSWYHYTRRVQAGVTVVLPVGSTEQVRASASGPPSLQPSSKRHDTHGWCRTQHAACLPATACVCGTTQHARGLPRPSGTPGSPVIALHRAARAPPAPGRGHLHRHRRRTACRSGTLL